MKFYNNKTRIPSAILERFLVAAGRSVGARTGKVVVKVTAGRMRGLASEGFAVYEWHLRNLKSRRRGRRILGRAIDTDGGWFHLSLPVDPSPGDPLTLAESVWNLAQHEWGHIRDYQAGGTRRLTFSRRGGNGRRPDHDSRPEEIRAERYIRESHAAVAAGKKRAADDEILALAVWYEEQL